MKSFVTDCIYYVLFVFTAKLYFFYFMNHITFYPLYFSLYFLFLYYSIIIPYRFIFLHPLRRYTYSLQWNIFIGFIFIKIYWCWTILTKFILILKINIVKLFNLSFLFRFSVLILSKNYFPIIIIYTSFWNIFKIKYI